MMAPGSRSEEHPPTLCPYTTLFRSIEGGVDGARHQSRAAQPGQYGAAEPLDRDLAPIDDGARLEIGRAPAYTLSLHDALPIYRGRRRRRPPSEPRRTTRSVRCR